MQIHWQMSVLGRSPDSDVVETEKTVNWKYFFLTSNSFTGVQNISLLNKQWIQTHQEGGKEPRNTHTYKHTYKNMRKA